MLYCVRGGFMAYAGVKFVDKGQIDSLFDHGFCAFVVSAQDRQANHPVVGDFVSLLLGASTLDERCAARLVADQEMPDGSVISIYAATASTFKKEV